MTLKLRPLALDDAIAFHGWACLPEACRYQAWGPNTYEQTQAYVQAAVAAPPAFAMAGVTRTCTPSSPTTDAQLAIRW